MERDIRALSQVGNLEDFARLLKLTILQTGNLLVRSRLASDIGLAQNTVSKYLSIMEQTFVLYRLRPYLHHARKRLVKSPKIYLFDTGFYSQTTGINNLELLEVSGKLGALFENLCFNELQKSISNEAIQKTIYYWRTSGGAEVDFILDLGNELIPIEVKFGNSFSRSDLRNLVKFRKEHFQKVKKMIFLYNGNFKIENDIIFLPLWLF